MVFRFCIFADFTPLLHPLDVFVTGFVLHLSLSDGKNGKRRAVIALLVLAAVIYAEYLKPKFYISKQTEKMVAITAKNAKEGAVLTAGTLTITDSEMLLHSSGLDRGTIRVDLYKMNEEGKVQTVKPIVTAWFYSGERRGGEYALSGPTGTYQVQITCMEQATGTVWLKVLSGE